jgi:hypothetical protein
MVAMLRRVMFRRFMRVMMLDVMMVCLHAHNLGM